MSDYVWGDNETQFFFNLTPEIVLGAIEKIGISVTGRCMTLNSMENRVYEIEKDVPEYDIESVSDQFIVAKFYRPGRWTKEQILDEHSFLLELQEEEIPVVAPIIIDGETLFKLEEQSLWYCIFPKRGGRVPDEMNEEQLQIMGRQLARMHNVGAGGKADNRIQISPQSFGLNNLKYLLDNKVIPGHFEDIYKDLVEEICQKINPLFEKVKTHRIHGDCHLGNILWRGEEGINFIDFDDMLIGPAIQDVWLVVPGREQYDIINRNILLEAYDSMRSFDYSSVKLIEPLRTLRYIHFTAWIANRWEDPSFKTGFSHFGSEHYWQTQVNDLREQLQLISVSDNTYGNY